MLEVRKKEREKSDRLVRRFSRLVQQSGILSSVKLKKFHERQSTKKETRIAAIRKNLIRAIRRKKREGY